MSSSPLLDWLPRGTGIPHDTWVVRHRWVVRILALQCVGLVIFALARGYSLTHSLVEALLPSVLPPWPPRATWARPPAPRWPVPAS